MRSALEPAKWVMRLRRRSEHDYIAATRLTESRQMPIREWNVRAIHQLVDEKPVANEKRGDHAPRWNTIRFDDECAQKDEE